MNKFISWLTSIHAPVWVDPIRMLVGAFIFYKGVVFATHFESFTGEIASVGWVLIASHLAHAILFVHLVSGIVLFLGAATRLMAFVNIPILIGAVIFNIKNLLNVGNYMELDLAIIALVMLILVFFMGAGRFSLDEMRRRADAKAST